MAEKFIREPALQTFEKATSPIARDFLMSQLRQSKKAAETGGFLLMINRWLYHYINAY